MFRSLTALTIFSTAILFAQGERSSLNGTVTDSTGSAIPNAAVTVTENATNVETKTSTTTSGVYRVNYLPPGNYKISISAAGFRTDVAPKVDLRVAQTLTVDFKLEIGQVSDQVTVEGESPQLETGSAEIGRYVTKREFDTWPIQVDDGQRQIQTFIFSSLPGTVGDTFQGSINGGQQYSHEILIEGMSLGRFDLQGGSNNEFSPSAEAVSEFKLQTGTIGAQYGGGQTAVANFAIKSGTNDLHGTAAVFVQNDILRANGFVNNALGREKPPYKLFNWTYGVGGPVYIPKVYNGRNKTFFFTNLEKTRVRNFASFSRSTLPIPAFKRGDFSRLLNPAFTGDPKSGSNIGTDALGRPVLYGQVYDPQTTRQVNGKTVRDPFPGNIIPADRFDPVAGKILQLAPITDPISDTLLNNIPNIGTCCPVFDQTTIGVKIDHIVNSNHRLSGYYNHEKRIRNNSPGGRWGIPPGTPTDVYQLQNTPGNLARFTEDWTISPSVINHFGAGYNRFGNLNYSAFINQDWPGKIGLQNVPQTNFPLLRFSGKPVFGGGIGAGGKLGSGNVNGSYNGSTIFADDLTIVRGSHSFKLGTEVRLYYYNNRTLSDSGTFQFSPQQTDLPGFDNNTGQSFASFLLGAVQSTSRSVILTNPGHRTHTPAFYFSDDWKVTKTFTLNMGLRWEIIGGIYEVAGRMTDIDFNKPNPGAGNLPGALVFAGDLHKKTFQDTNYKQLSPRFGFAWAPTFGGRQRFVLRGGYGINNEAPVTTAFDTPSLFGYNGSISLNAANTPRRFQQDPVTYLRNPYPSLNSPLPNKDPAGANGQGFTYVAPNSSKLGYVQNFNLGVGYQLPASFVLDLGYVGNKGTRLVSYG
ncbi:MAG: carboxypeptidase-like regulatory domain-containing protein, partial [Acidobacteriota bacterium]|nr:carboxypeptidase-like regulatory domain-containing protein [Acidobacteriota bacterium]